MFDAAGDPYLATPWVAGPAELLQYSLNVVSEPDSDINRRVGMVLIDNAVEVTAKVFLTLRAERGGLGMRQDKARELGFWGVLQALQDASPTYLAGLTAGAIMHLHEIRNGLYHGEAGTTPTRDNFERYAHAARVLFKNLFGIEAPTVRTTTATIAVAVADKTTDDEVEALAGLRLLLLRQPSGAAADLAREFNEKLNELVSSSVTDEDDVPANDVQQSKLVLEIEDFLRRTPAPSENVVSDSLTLGHPDTPTSPSKVGLDSAALGKFHDRVMAVENATYALYGSLAEVTFAERFGRIANLVASVLDRSDAELLGAAVSWRNQLSHGRLDGIRLEWQADLERLEGRLRRRVQTLTEAERAEWRRQQKALEP